MNELAKAVYNLTNGQKTTLAIISPREVKSWSELNLFLQELRSLLENKRELPPDDDPEPVEWNVPIPRLLNGD